MDLPIGLVVGTSAACFALLFLSAVVPFVNAELTFLAFVAAGTTGRFLRFEALAMFPPAVAYLVRG